MLSQPLTLVLLLVAFGSVTWFTMTLYRVAEAWWSRGADLYTDWLVAERDRMYQGTDTRSLRRLLALLVVVPAVFGFLMAGWPGAFLLATIGVGAPFGWVKYQQSARRARLDDQLVDAFILMANGLRAGLTLLQAIELASDELKPPISDEFGRLLKEVRLGTLIDDGLLRMADRLQLADLEIAVHSILTLRESGGNLSETFMTVAHTVVERKKIEGKISAMTAEGRYQGVMMCAMPFVLAIMMYFLNPDFIMPLFNNPLGWLVCAVVLLLISGGMFMVVQVTQVDV